MHLSTGTTLAFQVICSKATNRQHKCSSNNDIWASSRLRSTSGVWYVALLVRNTRIQLLVENAGGPIGRIITVETKSGHPGDEYLRQVLFDLEDSSTRRALAGLQVCQRNRKPCQCGFHSMLLVRVLIKTKHRSLSERIKGSANSCIYSSFCSIPISCGFPLVLQQVSITSTLRRHFNKNARIQASPLCCSCDFGLGFAHRQRERNVP